MAFQHTLDTVAVCAGVGLHTGDRIRITLKPADVGTGIAFVRTDVAGANPVVEANALNVTTTRLGTTIANRDGVSVSTVEHLLAACAGLGVDNLQVEIDGPEVPIMDGSSALYCRLMLQAGLRAQSAPRRVLRLIDTVEVRDGSKFARLSPGEGYELRVRIDFASAAIGEQLRAFRLTPGSFVNDLAFARTFGFARDVDQLRAMGLARGGSMQNAIVLDGDTVLNPEGLRVDDEFVRHKLLDAIGDLYLAGGLIEGVYEADQPGHALNNQLLRALFERPEAFVWSSADMPTVRQRSAHAMDSAMDMERVAV